MSESHDPHLGSHHTCILNPFTFPWSYKYKGKIKTSKFHSMPNLELPTAAGKMKHKPATVEIAKNTLPASIDI